MANRVKTFQLKIPSQTDNLEIIREFVTNIAQKQGFSADDIHNIELAVDEACTNVVKHAHSYDAKRPISIQIKTDKKKIKIIITDRGKGFQPDSVAVPNMEKYLSEMRVGGLGIYLMHSLMDEVDFKIEPGKHNRVTMVKYLPQQA